MKHLLLICFLIVDSAALAADVQLLIRNPSGTSSAAYPFTVGVPFARGELEPGDSVTLVDGEGKPIPAQTLVTATWNSQRDSVRWLLLDFVTSLKPGILTLALQTRTKVESPTVIANVATEIGDSLILDTGRIKLQINRKRFNLFDQVWGDLNQNHKLEIAEALLDAKSLRGPYIRDGNGQEFWAVHDPKVKVIIEENGPVKAVVMAKGFYTTPDGAQYCQFIVRITAHRGLPWVRTDQTFVFTEDSDKGHVITDLGCRLPLREQARKYAFEVVDGDVIRGSCGSRESVSLYQRDHEWFQLARYEDAKPLGILREGKKGTGSVSVMTGSARITAGVEDFWQQFPKELSADASGLKVHFWPDHGQKHPKWLLPENAFEKLGQNEAIRWLYPLYWAHEGQAMSFKMPPEVAQFGDRASDTFRYVKRGRPSNGMGVAKTHRVFFDFGTAGSEPDLCPL
ncbi:MAG: hypothetical protein QF886_21185, partial [Planctomycetota bacterium]|nr:hypothetical protein [Planctomycetota bacterium]